MTDGTLPKGLKHPGGGVPAPPVLVELAYASTAFDRITRVHMREHAARFWLERIITWKDVLRVVIVEQNGNVLEDRSNLERIVEYGMQSRADRVFGREGQVMAYTKWSPP